MKFYSTILLLSLFCFLTQSCVKQEVEARPEWERYCDDVSGGDITVTINGKNWNSACVQSAYSETNTAEYTSKILWVYAYNYGERFYADSEVEVFYFLHSEVTSNGQTETSSGAFFIDGFVVASPNSATWDGKSFASDEDLNSEVNITQWNANLAEGTMNFELVNQEDENESIVIQGSFSANIMN